MRLESDAQRDQLGANFGVIVDLAIEYDHVGAILGAHRLIASAEIDDLQPDGSERYGVRFVGTRLIRTSMTDALGRFAYALRSRHPVTV